MCVWVCVFLQTRRVQAVNTQMRCAGGYLEACGFMQKSVQILVLLPNIFVYCASTTSWNITFFFLQNETRPDMRIQVVLIIATAALAAPRPLHDTNALRLPERPGYDTSSDAEVHMNEVQRADDGPSKADNGASAGNPGPWFKPIPKADCNKFFMCWAEGAPCVIL
jgi:hypothetical protein